MFEDFCKIFVEVRGEGKVITLNEEIDTKILIREVPGGLNMLQSKMIYDDF